MSSAMPGALNYHRYLYQRLFPFLGSCVWEIGCGYGQYTRMLLNDGRSVVASDIDNDLLADLQANVRTGPDRLTVRWVDLSAAEHVSLPPDRPVDTVLSLNVLEHIRDDVAALRYIRSVVPTGTRAVFLTPAFEALYGFMDRDAGHFRRYTRGSLSAAFRDAGWRVRRSFYLNALGGLGWWVRSRVLRPPSASLDSPEVNADIAFFDRYCVPVTRVLDLALHPFFGQSVVVVAEHE